MTENWWKESVVYQIYPRSFCDSNHDGIGDIKGIIDKLDYLRQLGIDVIWLCPVYKSPNCDNGYDISDYQNIMDEFGTMKDFDELLYRAHEKGIKIIMDLVVNHTSDEHAWFIESKKKYKNPYHDFYIWREGKNGKEPTNWESWFSGSAWEYCEDRNMYYLHVFAKKQPDLNWDNPVVREEIYKLMRWWCEKGVDGFRMDVISMISKAEQFEDGNVMEGHTYGDLSPYVIHGPHVHEYLKEMNTEVLSRYDLMTVGETAGVTPEEAINYAGFDRRELNMVFHFEHMDLDFGEKGKWNDKPPKLTRLKEVMSRWQNELYDKAWNSLFWNNHDQPRIVSRFGNDKEYWEKSAKMLATCLHMMQGTPYIYQGEEIGMTNIPFTSIEQYRDIESHNAWRDLVENGDFTPEYMLKCLNFKSRDNARTPMQWDDSNFAGFSDCEPWIQVNSNYQKINAASQVNDPDSIFSYYKKLIQLRKEHKIIVYGKYQLIMEESEAVFAYIRFYKNEKLLVLCNFTDKDVLCQIPNEYDLIEKELLIGNYHDSLQDPWKLRSYEAKVFKYTD
ncbi:MAG: malL1 [Firmicutes bacterium]|nr:malL1 [Bacillota bacterium]